MNRLPVVEVGLVTNTAVAEYDCAWCGAIKGADVHSAACPIGERYKQVQQLGGVPWPREKPAKAKRVAALCLECGKPVEPHTLVCAECVS